MPALPRAPLPPGTLFKFDLRLTDAAGPLGASMPNMRWRVVVSASAALARMVPKFVLDGTSDSEGKVNLSTDQEKTLREAYDHHSGRLWIVYRTNVREVALTKEDPSWADAQRLDHALDALGYTDNYGPTGDTTADKATQALSRKELKTSGGDSTLNKLKG